MSKSANSTLSATIKAHNKLQRAELAAENCRRHLNAMLRKDDVLPSSIEMAQSLLDDAEQSVKNRKEVYRNCVSEVRVYKLDGTFVGVHEDTSRALQEVGTSERAYEREAEAVAAALYEWGQLDF